MYRRAPTILKHHPDLEALATVDVRVMHTPAEAKCMSWIYLACKKEKGKSIISRDD